MESYYFAGNSSWAPSFTNIIFVIVNFSFLVQNSKALFQTLYEMSQFGKGLCANLNKTKYLNFEIVLVQDSWYQPYELQQLSKNLQWFCSLLISFTFDQIWIGCLKYCLYINLQLNYMNLPLQSYYFLQHYLNFQNQNFSQCFPCCSFSYQFNHFA